MDILKKYISDLFLPGRFYLLAGSIAIGFIFSFFVTAFLQPVIIAGWGFLLLILIDYIFLFVLSKPPLAERIISYRLSNGDDNNVVLRINNRMRFSVKMDIIDELPEQFQVRDFMMKRDFLAGQEIKVTYTVKPAQRGEYSFGKLILFIRSRLGLLQRRCEHELEQVVAVYPSFMHIRKYQLLGEATIRNGYGNKRVRKIGQSMEFEQIKDYITGDDIRNINWKATARKGMLMVNNYTDERSQQVYCIIDKGRLMKMPFGALTLLDYAINSTLVMSNVCLQKQDRIGLVTFADRIGSIIAADRKPIQRENILQILYKQQTAYLESDFEMLYLQVRSKIKQRSLLILYTNFESMNGLHRQLNYLRSIARYHLLIVVFFENTELNKLAHTDALNMEDVYIKTIADKFIFEKKLIVKELMKFGILSILTSPENLTVSTVNKYLELKSKQAI